MNFDYIIVTLVAVAALGIQVISPFFCKTQATHELIIFFSKIHESLSNDVINENFFEFKEPSVQGVSKSLMGNLIKKYYCSVVVEAVRK